MIRHIQSSIKERIRREQERGSFDAIASIAFVTLAESGQIDDVTAGEHAGQFEEWACFVSYTKGQVRRHGGRLYRCLQGHTSQADWAPGMAPSLWVSISDPADEWPPWSQPIGAHDAYMKSDKVSHTGKRWLSDLDCNIWEPGIFGWKEA